VLLARKVSALFCVLAALLSLATSTDAQGGKTLIINGKVVSRDVRIINGRPYAPLADIARGTGQIVAKKGSGFELVAAGGANQVEGLRGKVGDTLFDGKWRFKVISVQKVPSYQIRWDGGYDPGRSGSKIEFVEAKSFRAAQGHTLVIANCHVRNGQKTAQALGTFYGQNTALADMQGTSYPSIGVDQQGGMFVTKSLLPGAGQDLALIFVVPDSAQLKDLVVTLTNVTDRKPTDVRISLAN
jgi:hypothetical protein